MKMAKNIFDKPKTITVTEDQIDFSAKERRQRDNNSSLSVEEWVKEIESSLEEYKHVQNFQRVWTYMQPEVLDILRGKGYAVIEFDDHYRISFPA
jgi:hypothetical protein